MSASMAGHDSGSETAGAPRQPRRARGFACLAGVAVDRPEAGTGPARSPSCQPGTGKTRAAVVVFVVALIATRDDDVAV